ncbi:MAG: hypothetical protein R2830_25060 [Saprospiraceae bacterium]
MENRDEILFDKIEAYLGGKLTEEEAATFEQQAAADPALRELLDLHRFEREGVEYLIEQDLRGKMESWKTAPPDENPADLPRTKRRWWLLLLAAGLLGGVVFFVVKFNAQPHPAMPPVEENPPAENKPIEQQPAPKSPPKEVPIANTEENKAEKMPAPQQKKDRYLALANTFYDLPENLGSGRRNSDETGEQNALTPAIKAFKSNPPNYPRAIVELKKITKENSPTEFAQAQEMLAHAYFNNNQYKAAATIFQKMRGENLSPTAKDRTDWYLLLSLLPDFEKQRQQVDALLDDIISEEYHNYRKKAADLRKALEKQK